MACSSKRKYWIDKMFTWLFWYSFKICIFWYTIQKNHFFSNSSWMLLSFSDAHTQHSTFISSQRRTLQQMSSRNISGEYSTVDIVVKTRKNYPIRWPFRCLSVYVELSTRVNDGHRKRITEWMNEVVAEKCEDWGQPSSSVGELRCVQNKTNQTKKTQQNGRICRK